MKNKIAYLGIIIISMVLHSYYGLKAQTIVTFAGSTNGYSGDGGQATAAQMKEPYDVTSDGTNIFFVRQ